MPIRSFVEVSVFLHVDRDMDRDGDVELLLEIVNHTRFLPLGEERQAGQAEGRPRSRRDFLVCGQLHRKFTLSEAVEEVEVKEEEEVKERVLRHSLRVCFLRQGRYSLCPLVRCSSATTAAAAVTRARRNTWWTALTSHREVAAVEEEVEIEGGGEPAIDRCDAEEGKEGKG